MRLRDRSEFNTRSLVRIMQDRCTCWLHDLCADRVVLRALTLPSFAPDERAYTRPARCEVSPRRRSAESLKEAQARSCQHSSRTRSLRRPLKKSQELLQAPRCAKASCAPGGVWHLVSRRGVITDPKPNRKDRDV